MKCLRIMIDGEEHPRYPIQNAFVSVFGEVETIWWQRWENDKDELQRVVLSKLTNNHYDFVFMQIQQANIIYPETLESAYERMPIFNWTGDVRNDLSYYIPIGKHCITLFSNDTDPQKMRDLGFRSDYLQTGYDTNYYYNKNHNRKDKIVFLGNNFDHNYFAQSDARVQMVRAMKQAFPSQFEVYGINWKGVDHSIRPTQDKIEESNILNDSLIALNIPHINCAKYYSDRQLRAMACGCLVLTQEYPEISPEFQVGEHLDTWRNFDELIGLCHFYLENRERAIQIGNNAIERVSNYCTWEYRMEELKLLINKYKQ